RNYLSRLDLGVLIENINNFRQHDLRYLDRLKITELLTKVFFAPIGNGKSICALVPQSVNPPVGTRLFRVRKNEFEEESNTINFFDKIDDLWAPPPNICKQSRINKEKESVLYVSFGNSDPLEECRLKKGDVFTQIRYNTIKPFNLCHLGRPDFISDNLDVKTKLNVLYGFLEEILMTPVGENNEY